MQSTLLEIPQDTPKKPLFLRYILLYELNCAILDFIERELPRRWCFDLFGEDCVLVVDAGVLRT